MGQRYQAFGKQVLRDNEHYADARDEVAAYLIATGLNILAELPEIEGDASESLCLAS